MRSPGPYWLKPEEFTGWLARFEAAGTPLWNPPEVLRWNMHKSYLADLAGAGVEVVPTVWLERGAPADLAGVLSGAGLDRAVVKPAISAAAYRTWVASPAGAVVQQPELESLLAEGDVMIQPFLPEIVTEGEWSITFFGGEHSHSFIKRAAPGDFRVQTLYGGELIPSDPPPALLEQAAAALEGAPGELLYARVDGIRRGDRLIVLELEVFEPVLYFGLDPESPRRFAKALAARV